jgi:iron complex outermembrane recepter protein
MINKYRYFYLIIFCVTSMVNAEEQNTALDLSIEDLMNVKVTSVAKKVQSLNDAPAAAFVISNEDIKRSGATNIPDALRLAPGLNVARIDSNKWAVSSRGFNGRRANKLLVLVDGRSAYTRSFAGVYWENQDVMMEDVDRIEVIRGPGATLWGANAINGVINIITKSSAKTQGFSFNAGGGNQEQDFGSLRYGMRFGKDTTARAYVKGFNRANNTYTSGGSAGDNWDKVQGGFRVDSQLDTQDSLTLQGDAYNSNINQNSVYQQIAPPFSLSQNDTNHTYGGNLLSRWQHTYSSTSDSSLQFYYDTYTRDEASFFEKRDTLDLDFQHRFALLDSHEIVWGLNYRYGNDKFIGKRINNGTIPFNINPTSVNDQVFSGFVQDEMSLINNKLWLTIGSKFEHNDYSGFEGQPSARIMWAPYAQHRLWAGLSRAVRTPARFEQSLSALTSVVPPSTTTPPVAVFSQGNPNFRSENVISYEMGYRTSFSKSVSLDVTGFYNDYNDLRQSTRGTPVFNGAFVTQPVLFTNALEANSYGIEVATVWQMLDWWRWDINYSWLHTQLNRDAKSEIPVSPQQRVSLRGAVSPWNNIDMDFWFRYVDTNFAQTQSGTVKIKPYVTLDLRLAYRPIKNLELSLVGQNLLAEKHLEYVNEIQTLPTAIDRGMYGKISWGF